ncbi:hypothetical protein MNBD_GAMMA12-3971 [hydrothermal vent metagenome]|uniref:MPN domain-containing protein n=1 Tax=hydrothermal vent metagenome TaxID=652676 RepID=A0A3B0YSG6_9ZZZZ
MLTSSSLKQINLSTATHLLKIAQSSSQQEVCGLITCDSNNQQICYPINNIASTPNTHFEMDPQQLISTTKLIRELGQSMIAIYHSHPNGCIEPSTHDIQQHQYHDLLYIIISPGNDGVLMLGAYWIHPDQTVEPVELSTQS